jgi:hypothetical protein
LKAKLLNHNPGTKRTKGGKNKQNTRQAKEFQNAGKPKPPKEKTALKKQGKQQA